MSKQIKQFILTGCLIVVLAFVTLGNLKKKPSKAPIPETQTTVSLAPPVAVLSPSMSAATPAAGDTMRIQQLERGKLSWGRDPFIALFDKEFKMDELKLQGISFGKGRAGYAFINNEIVKQGDAVGGYEVVEVQKAKVLLKKESQSFYLTFPGEQNQ
ncbi:MAG: hypothetical protein WDL87_07175 [Candidatus Omnitrophota bacterium]|jgi:hypothetical protein